MEIVENIKEMHGNGCIDGKLIKIKEVINGSQCR
jgi:hypothetical protein